jgi:hypothetical protein
MLYCASKMVKVFQFGSGWSASIPNESIRYVQGRHCLPTSVGFPSWDWFFKSLRWPRVLLPAPPRACGRKRPVDGRLERDILDGRVRSCQMGIFPKCREVPWSTHRTTRRRRRQHQGLCNWLDYESCEFWQLFYVPMPTLRSRMIIFRSICFALDTAARTGAMLHVLP